MRTDIIEVFIVVVVLEVVVIVVIVLLTVVVFVVVVPTLAATHNLGSIIFNITSKIQVTLTL